MEEKKAPLHIVLTDLRDYNAPNGLEDPEVAGAETLRNSMYIYNIVNTRDPEVAKPRWDTYDVDLNYLGQNAVLRVYIFTSKDLSTRTEPEGSTAISSTIGQRNILIEDGYSRTITLFPLSHRLGHNAVDAEEAELRILEARGLEIEAYIKVMSERPVPRDPKQLRSYTTILSTLVEARARNEARYLELSDESASFEEKMAARVVASIFARGATAESGENDMLRAENASMRVEIKELRALIGHQKELLSVERSRVSAPAPEPENPVTTDYLEAYEALQELCGNETPVDFSRVVEDLRDLAEASTSEELDMTTFERLAYVREIVSRYVPKTTPETQEELASPETPDVSLFSYDAPAEEAGGEEAETPALDALPYYIYGGDPTSYQRGALSAASKELGIRVSWYGSQASRNTSRISNLNAHDTAGVLVLRHFAGKTRSANVIASLKKKGVVYASTSEKTTNGMRLLRALVDAFDIPVGHLK